MESIVLVDGDPIEFGAALHCFKRASVHYCVHPFDLTEHELPIHGLYEQHRSKIHSRHETMNHYLLIPYLRLREVPFIRISHWKSFILSATIPCIEIYWTKETTCFFEGI